jgi:hypothetical protein
MTWSRINKQKKIKKWKQSARIEIVVKKVQKKLEELILDFSNLFYPIVGSLNLRKEGVFLEMINLS